MSSPVAAGVSRLPSGSWIADPARSTVGVSVEYLGRALPVRFERFAARLDAHAGSRPALTGAVEADSAITADPDLARLVASPALLDALHHPVLRFRSTAIRRADEHVELDGGLTVKNRTLTVTAVGTIEHEAGAERLRIELETTVDRRQFGLAWNAARPDGGWALGTEVRVHADLACTPDRARRPTSTATPPAGRSRSLSR